MQWDAKLAIFKTTSMSARISDFARAACIRSFHTVRLDGWQLLMSLWCYLQASVVQMQKKFASAIPLIKPKSLLPQKLSLFQS